MAADLTHGWGQTEARPFVPPREIAGFIGGTQVQFETVSGATSVGSTAACFDTPANAEAQYEIWGAIDDGCITADLSPVDAIPLMLPQPIGDQSKAAFCPPDEAGTTRIAGSASVYAVVGATAFSVTYSQFDMTDVSPAVLTLLVAAATALASRL